MANDSFEDVVTQNQAVPSSQDGVSRRRWWPLLLPLALLAVALSLATPAGRHQWAVSIIRQPTQYTELSFNNAAALPATATQNEPIKISFTIGNNQGQAVSYRYVVSESPATTSKSLYSAEKTIPTGTKLTIPITVRPTCPSSPCKIAISLPGHPETIDFLVNLTF
jgi:hypothetical protein